MGSNYFVTANAVKMKTELSNTNKTKSHNVRRYPYYR